MGMSEEQIREAAKDNKTVTVCTRIEVPLAWKWMGVVTIADHTKTATYTQVNGEDCTTVMGTNGGGRP